MTDPASEAARRLASMRRLYNKTCPVCGAQFLGIARRVYDRPACQVKAYRQRKREAARRKVGGQPSSGSGAG